MPPTRRDSAGLKFLQCGSANGDGTGDAGFEYGPLENVPKDGVYEKGTIAIARSDSPYSQSTQFFIVYGDTTLDGYTGGYTVVGKVTSGLSELESEIAAKGIASPAATAPASPRWRRRSPSDHRGAEVVHNPSHRSGGGARPCNRLTT
ncbi:peptidylprolyl isomerase [Curtobacterium flaccumfaciens]|nr:peptidylprolyl isomerase [Curtobacterium flaccumfaciens]